MIYWMSQKPLSEIPSTCSIDVQSLTVEVSILVSHDIKEFLEIARAVATGFVIMGFIGFFVKLIHIPINNIIVYDEAI